MIDSKLFKAAQVRVKAALRQPAAAQPNMLNQARQTLEEAPARAFQASVPKVPSPVPALPESPMDRLSPPAAAGAAAPAPVPAPAAEPAGYGEAWNKLLGGNLGQAWGAMPTAGKVGLGAGGGALGLLALQRLLGKRRRSDEEEEKEAAAPRAAPAAAGRAQYAGRTTTLSRAASGLQDAVRQIGSAMKGKAPPEAFGAGLGSAIDQGAGAISRLHMPAIKRFPDFSTLYNPATDAQGRPLPLWGKGAAAPDWEKLRKEHGFGPGDGGPKRTGTAISRIIAIGSKGGEACAKPQRMGSKCGPGCRKGSRGAAVGSLKPVP
jgi:hypothetical protein